MKMIIRTLMSMLAVTILGAPAAAQTVHVADNNATASTGANVHASLAAAIAAAVDGDIIHVVPSATDYGGVNVTKRLDILGVGHTPDKDLPLTANVVYIQLIGDGAGNTPSGSKISGLEIGSYIKIDGASSGLIRDITIEKCNIPIIDSFGLVDSLTIMNNMIASTRSAFSSNTDGIKGIGISNTTVINNIIRGYLQITNGTAVISNNIIFDLRGLTAQNGLIVNNVLAATTTSPRTTFGATVDCIISNNIFYGSRPTGPSGFQGNLFNNNISFGTAADALPPPGGDVGNSGSNNQAGVDPLFTNFPAEGSIAIPARSWLDFDFRLQPSSPGKNAGSDGTDIGIFGGAYPFDFFSRTGSSLPTIQTLNIPNIITQGDDITVEIKVRGN